MKATIVNGSSTNLSLIVEAETNNDRTLLDLFLKEDKNDSIGITGWTSHSPNIGIESIQISQSAIEHRYLKYTSIFTIIFKKIRMRLNIK